MGITLSISLALPLVCVLFIPLMQSVNGAIFLNTTSISLFPPQAAIYATVIVPLTSIYASL